MFTVDSDKVMHVFPNFGKSRLTADWHVISACTILKLKPPLYNPCLPWVLSTGVNPGYHGCFRLLLLLLLRPAVAERVLLGAVVLNLPLTGNLLYTCSNDVGYVLTC